MNEGNTAAVWDFVRRAGRLKEMLRTAWSEGGRQESVAEHSWRLGLLALALKPRYPELDGERLLALCLVHDLGEAIHGDIPAVCDQSAKADDEKRDVLDVLRPLPEAERARLLALWQEYEDAVTPEARLVKALDKMETILQHNQGKNPPDFDYEFNLDYGAAWVGDDPVLKELRAVLDEETRACARCRDERRAEYHDERRDGYGAEYRDGHLAGKTEK